MNKESKVGYKYSTSIDSTDLRSEINGKVGLDKNGDFKRKVEVNLVDTLALNDLVKKIKMEELTLEDKRSEIAGKISNNSKQDNNKLEKIKENKIVEDKSELVENITEENENFCSEDRGEILGKFTLDENSKKHIEENKKRREIELKDGIKMEDTLALKNIVTDVTLKSKEEKRTEISNLVKDEKIEILNDATEVGIVEENEDSKNLEDIEDKKQENVENISLAMVIGIVVGCLVVGAILGFMLYNIAMGG